MHFIDREKERERERTVEKIVNVTAHCPYTTTSPLTVPLVHISAFSTDDADRRLDLKF